MTMTMITLSINGTLHWSSVPTDALLAPQHSTKPNQSPRYGYEYVWAKKKEWNLHFHILFCAFFFFVRSDGWMKCAIYHNIVVPMKIWSDKRNVKFNIVIGCYKQTHVRKELAWIYNKKWKTKMRCVYFAPFELWWLGKTVLVLLPRIPAYCLVLLRFFRILGLKKK